MGVGVGAQKRACACARVALIIQHATSRILSSAASLAPPYFSTLSQKDFRKSYLT